MSGWGCPPPSWRSREPRSGGLPPRFPCRFFVPLLSSRSWRPGIAGDGWCLRVHIPRAWASRGLRRCTAWPVRRLPVVRERSAAGRLGRYGRKKKNGSVGLWGWSVGSGCLWVLGSVCLCVGVSVCLCVFLSCSVRLGSFGAARVLCSVCLYEPIESHIQVVAVFCRLEY